MGKIIVFASGKGGCGKTTFTVNIGAALAGLGKKVLILDLNFGLRNDDIYLGLEDRILFDLGDVVSGVCKLEKAIVSSDICDNLDLISCPQNKKIDGITSNHIAALYSRLKVSYDYVLVDTPLMTGDGLSFVSDGVDCAVIVVTPDYTSVRNSDSVSKKIFAEGVRSQFFIVNQIIESGFGNEYLPDLDYINKTLDGKCIGLVPFDISIHISNNSGSPVSCYDNSYLSDLFKKIALEL